jgi:hypothetical protein
MYAQGSNWRAGWAPARSVLLLRLTEKRFSATQFALLSSLFTIPRGPPAGCWPTRSAGATASS